MKVVLEVLIIIVVLIISFFIVCHTVVLTDGTAVIIRDDFIISFLGIIAGFAIATISLLYANINSILENIKLFGIEKTDAKDHLTTILGELMQDTIFIVLSLAMCVAVIIIRDINGISFGLFGLSTMQMVSIVKIALILLTLISLIDIVVSVSKISNISKKDMARKWKHHAL